MQLFSYHNHSRFSDGGNTPEEMILAAKAAGLKEFGLSDHFVVFPDGKCPDWCIPAARYQEYFSLMRELKEKYASADFCVKIGVEVDYFADSIDKVKAILADYHPDYAIGAVHFNDDLFEIDNQPAPWTVLNQSQIDSVWHAYWKKYAQLATSDYFDFFAHIDLPKKFQYMPSYDYLPEAFDALKRVQASGRPLELNTAGWFKTCKEQYPSEAILDMIRELDIPMLISADAHDARDVIRGFKDAETLLAQHHIRRAILF